MRTIEVTNLSAKAGETHLRQFLSYCGPIRRIKLEDSPLRGRLATVVFEEDDAVDIAKHLTGAVIVDKPVEISEIGDGPATKEDALSFLGGVLSKGLDKGEALFNMAQERKAKQNGEAISSGTQQPPSGESAPRYTANAPLTAAAAATGGHQQRGLDPATTSAATTGGRQQQQQQVTTWGPSHGVPPTRHDVAVGAAVAKEAAGKKVKTVKVAFGVDAVRGASTDETWMYGQQPQWGSPPPANQQQASGPQQTRAAPPPPPPPAGPPPPLLGPMCVVCGEVGRVGQETIAGHKCTGCVPHMCDPQLRDQLAHHKRQQEQQHVPPFAASVQPVVPVVSVAQPTRSVQSPTRQHFDPFAESSPTQQEVVQHPPPPPPEVQPVQPPPPPRPVEGAHAGYGAPAYHSYSYGTEPYAAPQKQQTAASAPPAPEHSLPPPVQYAAYKPTVTEATYELFDSMGFDRGTTDRALAANKYSADAALDKLLSGVQYDRF